MTRVTGARWMCAVGVMLAACCGWARAAEYDLSTYYPQTLGSQMKYLTYTESSGYSTDYEYPETWSDNDYLFAIQSTEEVLDGKSCRVQTAYIDEGAMQQSWSYWDTDGFHTIENRSLLAGGTSTVYVSGYDVVMPRILTDGDEVMLETRSTFLYPYPDAPEVTQVDYSAWSVWGIERIDIAAGTFDALCIQATSVTSTLYDGIEYENGTTVRTTTYWLVQDLGIAYMIQENMQEQHYIDETTGAVSVYVSTSDVYMELCDTAAPLPEEPTGPKTLVASVTQGTAPLEVEFQARNYRGSLTITWDFDNDGWYDEVTSSRTTAWLFTEGGTYTITAEVWTYDASEPDVYTFTITVTPSPDAPVMHGITAVADSATAPTTVTFTANVSPGLAPIAEYLWDFDSDGWADEITAEPSVEFFYFWPGDWQVVVSAYDEAGLSVTGQTTITIEEPTGPHGYIWLPWDGDEVAGESVFIGVDATPATTGVALFYRAAGATEWLSLGQMENWSMEWYFWWDTTLTPDGSYELRAVVHSTDGQQAEAGTVTVTIVNALVFGTDMPGREETSFTTVPTTLSDLPVDTLQGTTGDGERIALRMVEPEKKAEMKLQDIMDMVVPAGAITETKTLRLREMAGDRLQKAAAKARGTDRLRERDGTGIVGVTLDAEGEDIGFANPVKLTLRYSDVNNDGKEDLFGIDEKLLSVFRQESRTGLWREAPSTQDAENNIFTVTTTSTGSYLVAKSVGETGLASSVTVAVTTNATVYRAGDTVTVAVSVSGAAESTNVYLALDLGGSLLFLQSLNVFHPAGAMQTLDGLAAVRLPDAAPQNAVYFQFQLPAGLEGLSCNWIAGVTDARVSLDQLTPNDLALASVAVRVE